MRLAPFESLLEKAMMTKLRANEIGLILLQRQMMRESIRFDGLSRELGRVAKETGIPQTELHEFFMQHLLPNMIAQGLTASGTINFEYVPPTRGSEE